MRFWPDPTPDAPFGEEGPGSEEGLHSWEFGPRCVGQRRGMARPLPMRM